MKKHIFETKRIKLIARVMLLLLLLASALSFAGCAEKGKYKYISSCSQVKAINATAYISDTEFDIDNVNIDLYYGVHELNIFGQKESNPKEQLPNTLWNSEFTLLICLCNAIHRSYYKDDCCVEIKKIGDSDLFSEDYGYISTPFFISNGVIYKHRENIQIPSYMFDKDSGEVNIFINLFVIRNDTNIGTGINIPVCQSVIELRYKKIDNDKIILSGYWQ